MHARPHRSFHLLLALAWRAWARPIKLAPDWFDMSVHQYSVFEYPWPITLPVIVFLSTESSLS
jgi:hypothetical protein